MRLLGVAGLVLSGVSLAVIALFHSAAWAPSPPGLALVWALPCVFGLHIFEEFGFPGGFREWSVTVRPESASSMTSAHLWRVNLIGGLAAVGVALGALDYSGGYSRVGIRVWLVVLCTLGVNAFSHIAGAFSGRRYGPGLVTSVALYLPLLVAGVSYLLLAHVVDPASALVFAAVGVPAYLLLISRLRRMARTGTSA